MEQDTINLLKECDAGVQMGIASIKEVLPYVESAELAERLRECMKEHDEIAEEVKQMLIERSSDGKSPNPIAKGMSYLKTNAALMMNDDDRAIANVLTDGCDMGVKSLNKFLNQYKNADRKARAIAEKLVRSEERLSVDLRSYL